ncbi:MAG: hypothetical protein ACMXX9_00145 [Candidatus Woesearchaeota archaeon]
MNYVIEESAKIKVDLEPIVHKKMNVFYNPDMKLNRDLSIYILQEYSKDNWRVGLPLAGSGIRAIRIKKEVTNELEIHVNDLKQDFKERIDETCRLNEVELNVHNEDANVFLSKHKFDYVDVDPFGSPNPFLDSAVRSLKNKGILAVTATDTGALCGSFVNACKRKYWAKPKRDERMHENGLRILIRKIQLVGAQHSLALIPIYSISQLHYMKVFFFVDKGKKKVDELLKKHDFKEDVGPMWIGDLWDSELAKNICLKSDDKITKLIYEESLIKGELYDVHQMAKRNNLKSIPKFEDILSNIKGSRSHFDDKCIRTKLNEKEIVKVIQQLF